MGTACAVKMENITKKFGSIVANHNINLELHEGEILSLLGENGSGYTKEANFVSWNGNDAKLDIRIWYPGHERCGKGVTLTEDEGRNLYEALKEIYEPE